MRDYLQRYAEAETACRNAIARDPDSAMHWNTLGNLLCDYFDRPTEAAEAYDRAEQLDPTNEAAFHNRAFLRRDFMGEGATARLLLNQMPASIELIYPDTGSLHEALFAAYDANWDLTSEALGKALTVRANGFSPENQDDWLRASAVLLHLNYGSELLALLAERGDTIRLRPWVEALRAHHIGDRRALQNVAPEIRTSAEMLYDGIESRLRRLPAKTRRRPIAKPKRTRLRRA